MFYYILCVSSGACFAKKPCVNTNFFHDCILSPFQKILYNGHMRIGINGQRLLLDTLAGAELYTVNIIKGFAKVDLQNQYIVYLTTVPGDAFWHDLVGN